jgi:hypothetical protein
MILWLAQLFKRQHPRHTHGRLILSYQSVRL